MARVWFGMIALLLPQNRPGPANQAGVWGASSSSCCCCLRRRSCISRLISSSERIASAYDCLARPSCWSSCVPAHELQARQGMSSLRHIQV